MFRSKRLREYQFFANTEWNGGIYATTCMAGSRPGNVVAGTWASMLSMGRNGMKEKARGILQAHKNMRKALENNPDITVISTQDSPVFSFTSKTFNALAICEQMKVRRRWMLGKVQRPFGAHLTVTDANKDSW